MRAFGPIAHIEYAGINAIIIYFTGTSLNERNDHVLAFTRSIEHHAPDWLRNLIPAYESLVVEYDLLSVDSHEVYRFLTTLKVSNASVERTNSVIELPVWYGAEEACDFEEIRTHTGLSQEQIIEQHSAQTYRVYTVGFAPGFAYMGEIPQTLACLRKKTPRKHVPRGAVAIADRQTAVYPAASPGGWQLLGLCPLTMYQQDAEAPSRLRTGDRVKFVSITEQEYRGSLDGTE